MPPAARSSHPDSPKTPSTSPDRPYPPEHENQTTRARSLLAVQSAHFGRRHPRLRSSSLRPKWVHPRSRHGKLARSRGVPLRRHPKIRKPHPHPSFAEEKRGGISPDQSDCCLKGRPTAPTGRKPSSTGSQSHRARIFKLTSLPTGLARLRIEGKAGLFAGRPLRCFFCPAHRGIS